MRKVSERVIASFLNREYKKEGNTATNGEVVYLHHNPIIRRNQNNFEIRLAGWNTPTTRSRLNDFLTLVGSDARVYQHQYTPYLEVPGDEPIEMDVYDWYQV